MRFADLRYHFQPIVHLGSGEPVGYEALLRPRGGSPGAFLATLHAEGDGACRAFDAGSVPAACRDAAPWIGGRRLFVNVTAATVASVAAGEGWPATGGLNVVWEIPETEGAVRELPRPGGLANLTAGGAEIAMDDLGAGWADLQRLAVAGPECWLKIDRAIIHELPGARAAAILRAIGRSGPRVIAEGIETQEQLRLVQESGIPYGQGFLLDAMQQDRWRLPVQAVGG